MKVEWRPGKLSGSPDYEIHDELVVDDLVVAVLEVFASSPEAFYCNALTPAGEHRRIGAGVDYARTKAWAEAVAGLRPGLPERPREHRG